MLFEVYTSGYYYDNNNEITKLKELGFMFRPSGRLQEIIGRPSISIESIDELIGFIKVYGDVVIHVDYDIDTDQESYKIEIYNDYRE